MRDFRTEVEGVARLELVNLSAYRKFEPAFHDVSDFLASVSKDPLAPAPRHHYMEVPLEQVLFGRRDEEFDPRSCTVNLYGRSIGRPRHHVQTIDGRDKSGHGNVERPRDAVKHVQGWADSQVLDLREKAFGAAHLLRQIPQRQRFEKACAANAAGQSGPIGIMLHGVAAVTENRFLGMGRGKGGMGKDNFAVSP